jgi:uncharacterized protein (DUF952 family)
MKTLYRLAPWNAQVECPESEDVAPDPEGYVHLCYGDQIEGVVRRFFVGTRAWVLVVDRQALDPTLLKEEDTHGHGLFPHYYGTIPNGALSVWKTVDGPAAPSS